MYIPRDRAVQHESALPRLICVTVGRILINLCTVKMLQRVRVSVVLPSVCIREVCVYRAMYGYNYDSISIQRPFDCSTAISATVDLLHSLQ